jgi:hypothetical protein
MHAGFWWGNLEGRNHLEGLGIDGKIILTCVLKAYEGRAWTGLIWLSAMTSGRPLSTR